MNPLRFVIDSKRQFYDHIKRCIKTHKTFMLSQIRYNSNKETALTIFKTMILPYIEYGNVFHSTYIEEYKGKLQVIKRSLKITLSRERIFCT